MVNGLMRGWVGGMGWMNGVEMGFVVGKKTKRKEKKKREKGGIKKEMKNTKSAPTK